MFTNTKNTYRKVASSGLSRLVAHFHIFRLFMKGNFDALYCDRLDKMDQNWIVDQSTARNFTVFRFILHYEKRRLLKLAFILFPTG